MSRGLSGMQSDPPDRLQLTLYEENRTPHFPGDNAVVELPWNAFNDLMKCPVCLSIFDKPYTTKECLHRFCQECIQKSLRFGKKQCPTCRKDCPTHRSLRADEDFEKIISIVFPDRSILERQHESLLENLKYFSNPEAAKKVYDDGLEVQKEVANRRLSSKRPDTSPDRDDELERPYKRASTGSKSLHYPASTTGQSSKVELIFQVMPSERHTPQVAHKYLVTTPECTMAHLERYLLIRMKGKATDIQPSFYTTSSGHEGSYKQWSFNDSLKTLLQDREHNMSAHDRENTPLIVYYTLQPLL